MVQELSYLVTHQLVEVDCRFWQAYVNYPTINQPNVADFAMLFATIILVLFDWLQNSTRLAKL